MRGPILSFGDDTHQSLARDLVKLPQALSAAAPQFPEDEMGADGATWEYPGATNWIGAEVAHFVICSKKTGAMGAAEIIPFADLWKAKSFVCDEGGTISRLEQSPDAAVLMPDADALYRPPAIDATRPGFVRIARRFPMRAWKAHRERSHENKWR